jgi:hypothetical protein
MIQSRMIHVLLIDNYFPELCEISLPTIEAWAKKINAKVNYITKRRWSDWPMMTEKLQVWYDGADQDWNIFVDADVLIHPDAPDFLSFQPADHVTVKDAYHAHKQFKTDDPYFLRDGRDLGLSACFLASSRWCHDLWRPLPEEMDVKQAVEIITQERKCIDEYSLSRNLARFGLKICPPVDPNKDYNLFYHLGTFGEDKDRVLTEARRWRDEIWKGTR